MLATKDVFICYLLANHKCALPIFPIIQHRLRNYLGFFIAEDVRVSSQFRIWRDGSNAVICIPSIVVREIWLCSSGNILKVNHASALFSKGFSAVLGQYLNEERIVQCGRPRDTYYSNPGSLVEMPHFSSELDAIFCSYSSLGSGISRFHHLIKLASINEGYAYPDEDERELHPIVPSLPVRFVCSFVLCIVGWYLGYRGRIAWDRRHFLRAIVGFALLVCFAGLAIHVFFYL